MCTFQKWPLKRHRNVISRFRDVVICQYVPSCLLFKNDIIKQFIKNYSYYISTAEKLLKYETNLIETYGTSLVNSPVYRFSIQFDVKNVVERLKKLYCVYSSSENNIVNSLSVTCESIDKSKQNDEI